jgi:dUTP pyrophosphatase|tara:strand:+ start:3651 stop:4097 length:447 start_codon:yes stop_codon:yes gene_type:complete
MTLFITLDPENDYFWKNHPTYDKAKRNEDVGLDIPMQSSEFIPKNAKSHKINLKFKGEQNKGYMLVPRSSISKTTIRLSNSIGIIDKNYRGDVMVVIDNIGEADMLLQEGCCYFQIIAFDGILPKFQISNVNIDTSRGTGGFGSTGAA